jgi:hypothetical protein
MPKPSYQNVAAIGEARLAIEQAYWTLEQSEVSKVSPDSRGW